MASFRQCLHPCFGCIGSWLAEVVEPIAPEEGAPEEYLLELYTALGAASPLLDTLVTTVRLSWDPSRQKLRVLGSFLAGKNSLEELSGILSCIWRFHSFTASRWCTVGKACRAYSLRLVTGFMDLFEFAKKAEKITHYDAAGASDLPKEMHKFCLVVGLIAYLPESFLDALLSDNRLLQQAHALENLVFEELDYVEQRTPAFWKGLSEHVKGPPSCLRDQVVFGCQVALGYLDAKVFSVVAALPWSLARGDVTLNLQTLENTEQSPSEPLTRQIWALLKAGFPLAEMATAVRLWSSVSFTSHLTETMHASAALVKRHHPDYGMATLTNRAFIHIFRSVGPLARDREST